MKITNRNNLPSALVNFANDQREIVPKHYSVTEILNPTKMIILKRRHDEEISEDVSSMVWAIFGTAVHSLIERHDKTNCAEVKLIQEIYPGYYLTGRCDLYNEETKSLEDYKTANVIKVYHNDFSDWKKQGLMYAWMLKQKGIYLDNLKFHAILRDWTARDKRLSNMKHTSYPDSPIWTWSYQITTQDFIDIEEYIKKKFAEIISYEQMPDIFIPLCSNEDSWYSADKYAVMRNGRMSALKIAPSMEEAESYMKNKGGDYIVKRKGEYRRCRDYCLCKTFCERFADEKGEE